MTSSLQEKEIEFLKPRREVLSLDDLKRFNESETAEKFIGFIERLSGAVRGKKNSDAPAPSKIVTALVDLLNKLIKLTTESSEEETKHNSRYGNPAFRNWFDQMRLESENSLGALLPSASLVEVVPYFLSSFGNRQRIDYGTGNESAFVGFLYCMSRLGLFNEQDNDDVSLVLHVFTKYVELIRRLVVRYWLEPAGSHGVWGLDDYHFLPFLFGASQLEKHAFLRPKSIHDADLVNDYYKEYMYLDCIHFVNNIKTSSLRWHSPYLDDISASKSWEKICGGMFKMYRAEVLGKLPIMQHFLLGSILEFKSGTPIDNLPLAYEQVNHEECDDLHRIPGQLPSCCIQRMPSQISALQSEGRTLHPYD
eukprot:Lithocolla_globosa_v1_NODE_4975_length_1325_cov_19.598425.p1 type:complete len:365 gc:universal NODE_4975_length_1325_cov_19.598425:98-1192(+)